MAVRPGIDRYKNKICWTGSDDITIKDIELSNAGQKVISLNKIFNYTVYEIKLTKELEVGEPEHISLTFRVKDTKKVHQTHIGATVESYGNIERLALIVEFNSRKPRHICCYSYKSSNLMEASGKNKFIEEIRYPKEIENPKPGMAYAITWKKEEVDFFDQGL